MTRALDAQSIHLIVEAIDLFPDSGAANPEQPNGVAPLKLKLPQTHVFLMATPGETPRLQATAPESMKHAAVLEPICKGIAPPRLLVINSEGEQTKVNAAIAPRVAMLHAGDNFQINSAFAFHLALFYAPRIGAPRASSVGQKACAVCTTLFEAGSTVIECAQCGEEFHFEGDAGLGCANLIVNCPACAKPLVKIPSYAVEPVF